MGLFDIFKGKDPQKHEEQGDMYFIASAFGEAKLEYEAALEKRRKAMSNDFKIPHLQNKIQQCMEALAKGHKKQGDDLVKAGYFDDAREYYSLALDLAQDEALAGELEAGLRNIESLQAEKYGRDIRDFDEAEQEDVAGSVPESIDEYSTALYNSLPDDIREAYLNYGANFNKGYIALNRGQFDLAVDELSRALEEHPEPDSRIRLELATACLNLKRFEEASALLEEFIVHHPDDLPAYQVLCEIYWETSRFESAQRLLDSLSDEQQKSPDYCLLLGGTYFRAGKYPQAVSLYLEFLRDHGWNSDIAQALAGIYETDGDLKKAHELYGKIMELCSGCGARVHPLVKLKYADLSMAMGIQDEKILEIYLSMAEQDPDNAAVYYRKVSRIYAALGHEKESRRFQLIAVRYDGVKSP
ncbi:MAG: tetratricopeptide repeat protein [Acidobacteria bacterium]|nr:tetratricopeptide repeat protein [Acidobacteriota bacterium]